MNRVVDLPRETVFESQADRPKIRSLAERLASTKALGPKIPTGIDALDEHLRGGFRAQKLMAIGGAPGAGKTTLMVQIGRNLARSGVAVGFLAIDEEAAGIDARNLESVGIDRDKAEEPDQATIDRAVEELGSLPFVVFEECLVEDVFQELARLYPDQPRAVMVDSIQTARTRQSEHIEAIRERITDVIHTAKRHARAPGTEAMCFMTSELARGAYRSKQSAEQIEDLAAFKESGAVEYQAHVLLVLRTVKGESDLVSASMPKNRMGTKGAFGLRLVFSSATFSVEDLPEESDEDREEGRRAANAAQVAKDAQELARLIQRKPGIGERSLRAELRSAGLTWGRDRLDAAKSLLMGGHAGSVLTNRGNVRASAWHVEPSSGGDL